MPPQEQGTDPRVPRIEAVDDGLVDLDTLPIHGDPAADNDQAELDEWRNEWRAAIEDNKEWGPKLAEGFRDSRHGGPTAEYVNGEEIAPDVLIVSVMRKPGLWENIKQMRHKSGWRPSHLKATIKSVLPDKIEEKVDRAGWIISRREFARDEVAAEESGTDDADGRDETDASSELFNIVSPANEADPAKGEDDDTDKLIEHIVVTNDGATLRFVGDKDKRPRRRLRRNAPYRYVKPVVRKGLDKDRRDQEKEVLDKFLERNKRRYTNTMRFAGSIALGNFEEEGRLGPVYDELTPDVVRDGLDGLLERTRLVEFEDNEQATKAED